MTYPRSLRRLAIHFHSLRRSTSGLALVEFAVSLPVLLTLGLVGLETANYAMAHLRVSNIAAMTADNASRVRDGIDEADVNELFIGALLTGRSIDFEEHGRIILSSMEASPEDEDVQWIRWQRCIGDLNRASTHGQPLDDDGDPITDGTEYLDDDGDASRDPSSHGESDLTGVTVRGVEIAAQPGTAVMIAEVVYEYQPLVANAALAGTEIRYLSAFNVRQRVDQQLTDNSDNERAICEI